MFIDTYFCPFKLLILYITLYSDENKLMMKQLAFMLARQQVFIELDDDMEDCEELTEILSNTHLNNNFLALAREVSYDVVVFIYST